MGGGGREREMRGMRAKGARRGGALTPCGTAAVGAASVRSAHETQEQTREAKAAGGGHSAVCPRDHRTAYAHHRHTHLSIMHGGGWGLGVRMG